MIWTEIGMPIMILIALGLTLLNEPQLEQLQDF